MTTRRIYVLSESPIKVGVCEKMAEFMSEQEGIQYTVVPHKVAGGTDETGRIVEQPFDSTTYHAAKSRVCTFSDEYGDTLENGDMVVSFENGISRNSDSVYDFCVMAIFPDMVYYPSFGIEIDSKVFSEYLSYSGHGTINESGADVTFGDFLALKFTNVDCKNWSSDIRFGKVDRKLQLESCVNKFYLNRYARYIQDFPREGVLFKDITPIMDDPNLLTLAYSELRRIIEYNFDDIDYFAGLDARGFYFAPVLAQMFGKGFIPVRKAKKLPIKNDSSDIQVVTESYSTEYSVDEFGLIISKKYLGKNVLILDDLLATGGSIVGATKVLQNAGLNVLGAVTVYDVVGLRGVAYPTLSELPNFRIYTVMNRDAKITENEYACLKPDMKRVTYPMSEIMIQRIRAPPHFDADQTENTNGSIFDSGMSSGSGYPITNSSLPKLSRRYTLSTKEWNNHNIFAHKLDNVKVLYTDKDEALAHNIIRVLASDQNLSQDQAIQYVGVKVKAGLFPNGESHAFIQENIRNCHVFIVSRIRTGHINNDLMELYLIMDACNRSGVDKKTVVMPYYPYSRSDKKDAPRTHIGAAVQANFLTDLGVDNLISIDLHAGQIQGLVPRGFHNLYLQNYLSEYIYMNYLRYYPESEWNKKFVLIAPDAGSTKAIKAYSEIFKIDNIALDKSRNYKAAEEGKSAVNKVRFIGDREDFEGKIGLIIDDMADTMGTMSASVQTLVENGLDSAIVFVTHGVLSGPAMERIDSNKYIKEVVVSDTLPQEENKKLSPKLRVVSIAELLGRTIDGVLTGRSISRLFEKPE